MLMKVQAINEKGMIIDNVEIFVNGVPIGRTPNAVTSLSGAVWKSYNIKARCNGYNDAEFSVVKEPKWLMIILGAFFLWFLWLWAYGAKELQTIVMCKKADESTDFAVANMASVQQFVGKTWQDVFKENGLEQYIAVFEHEKLTDIDTILSLTEQDLEKIGIEKLGDRKRLITVLHK